MIEDGDATRTDPSSELQYQQYVATMIKIGIFVGVVALIITGVIGVAMAAQGHHHVGEGSAIALISVALLPVVGLAGFVALHTNANRLMK